MTHFVHICLQWNDKGDTTSRRESCWKKSYHPACWFLYEIGQGHSNFIRANFKFLKHTAALLSLHIWTLQIVFFCTRKRTWSMNCRSSNDKKNWMTEHITLLVDESLHTHDSMLPIHHFLHYLLATPPSSMETHPNKTHKKMLLDTSRWTISATLENPNIHKFI